MEKLKAYLDQKVLLYNTNFFIEEDPISIPHLFTKKQDIEISGFFAAIFAWGQRSTIIKKATLLMKLMDCAPYEFITGFQDSDLKKMKGYVHRTFNEDDLIFLLHFLKSHYKTDDSLESAFFRPDLKKENNIYQALVDFRKYVFDHQYSLERTRKHIASPQTGSTCKRLNMYLRWMLREDNNGVDFGIWNAVSKSDLIIPLDVHVHRVSLELGLINRKQSDWKAVMELMDVLRIWNPEDPVAYDYALFSLGVDKALDYHLSS